MIKKLAALILTWLLMGIFIAAPVRAQSDSSATLVGQVKDAETGSPLASVNIFLANTMRGAVSNDSGFYALPQVPLGTHELLVSLIGYKPRKYMIRLPAPSEARIDFKLEAKPVELPAVNIVAMSQREWKKNLKRFEKWFWGDVYNAAECKILNPEVLEFEVKKASRIFYATADQPFEIENKTLGYRAEIF